MAGSEKNPASGPVGRVEQARSGVSARPESRENFVGLIRFDPV
jgi:hypothetical protein